LAWEAILALQDAHDLRALGDQFNEIVQKGDEPPGSVLPLLRDAVERIYAGADRLLALEQNAPENAEHQNSGAGSGEPTNLPPGQTSGTLTEAGRDPVVSSGPPGPDKFNQPAGEAHPPADHADAAPGGNEPAPAKAGGKGGGKGDKVER
jgi:hypothetical protein